MSETQRVPDSVAISAICAMANRRGMHAGNAEAAQAWRQVTGSTFVEKLSAAWSWLFPGHTLEKLPLALVENAQLPAWYVCNGELGVLMRVTTGESPEVEWLTQNPSSGHEGIALVDVSSGLIEREAFVQSKRRGTATEAILSALAAHRPVFWRVALASLMMNLLSIVSALFTMQVYDRVVPNFAYATLWVLASGVLMAYVFDLVFKLIRLRILEKSALRLDEALSLYFFEKLLALKLDRRPARVGTLVAQVRDYEAIKNFFTSSTLFVIADLPFIVLFIAVVGMIGGPVAWVLLLFVLISLAAGFSVYRPMARLQREENDEAARKTGVLFEAVAGAEGIKTQGGESRFSDVWQRSTREAGQLGVKLRSVSAYAQFASAFLQQMSYVVVIMVGVYVIEAGHLTTGGLIACSILAGRVLNATSQITRLLLQWHHAKHALAVLDQVLDSPADDTPERQANTHAAPLNLTLAEVSYAYATNPDATPQLRIPALSIKQGERVAVLGRNGSGKTTLLKLLAGIATPGQGEVCIAGMDMQSCRPSWLREVIGYLPQEVRLFSGSLLENLTLGLSLPDEAQIRDAMERTGLAASLARHPQGLNLQIREGGHGLSGGQRQLVGLTRLVLQNPRIWLLDEPSASLDRDSEGRLIKLVREMPRDRTVIFTSHRQSWMALADRILFVDEGGIKVDAPSDQIRTSPGTPPPQGSAAAIEAESLT